MGVIQIEGPGASSDVRQNGPLASWANYKYRGLAIAIVGPNASGKDTVAYKIGANLGIRTPPINTRAALISHFGEEKISADMKAMRLVPDADVLEAMGHRLSMVHDPICIMTGFPRNVEQAVGLLHLCTKERTLLLVLRVDQNSVVARASGRFECRLCAVSYHRDSRPPLRQGHCDRGCGETLYRRPEDLPENAAKRYGKETKRLNDVLVYARGRGCAIAEIDGRSPINQVAADAVAAVRHFIDF